MDSNAYRNCKTLTYSAFNAFVLVECICKDSHYKVGTTNELCTTIDFSTGASNCAQALADASACGLC